MLGMHKKKSCLIVHKNKTGRTRGWTLPWKRRLIRSMLRARRVTL